MAYWTRVLAVTGASGVEAALRTLFLDSCYDLRVTSGTDFAALLDGWRPHVVIFDADDTQRRRVNVALGTVIEIAAVPVIVWSSSAALQWVLGGEDRTLS